MQPIFPAPLRMSDDFKPLGDAIKKPAEPKPDKFEQFRKRQGEFADKTGGEDQCKQIKPKPLEMQAALQMVRECQQAVVDAFNARQVNAPASPKSKQEDGLSAGEPARQFKVGDRVSHKAAKNLRFTVGRVEVDGDLEKVFCGLVPACPEGYLYFADELELIEPASPPPSTGVLEPEVGKVYLTKQRADAIEFEYFNYFSADGWLSGGMTANLACRRDHSPRAEVQDRIVIRLATPEELGA